MNTENKMTVATVTSSAAVHTEITYTQFGDYLLPDLTLDPQPEGEIGVWGWRRKMHLKERRKGTYNALLMNGTLTLDPQYTDGSRFVVDIKILKLRRSLS